MHTAHSRTSAAQEAWFSWRTPKSGKCSDRFDRAMIRCMSWFCQQPKWSVSQEHRINRKLNFIMATLSEALDGWRAYVADLKDQLAQAVSGLTDAQAAAQAAADALAAFQADDAATDASQLAAQAQADADAVQAALDAVKNPPVEPPVLSEPVV